MIYFYSGTVLVVYTVNSQQFFKVFYMLFKGMDFKTINT